MSKIQSAEINLPLLETLHISSSNLLKMFTYLKSLKKIAINGEVEVYFEGIFDP